MQDNLNALQEHCTEISERVNATLARSTKVVPQCAIVARGGFFDLIADATPQQRRKSREQQRRRTYLLHSCIA